MRRLRVLIALVAALAGTAVALVVPGNARATNYNVWQTENGLCMGVQGGNMMPGTAIITWTCDSTNNQFWSMDSNSGAPNTWLLRDLANPTECLSVFLKETGVGAPLVIWPCKQFSDNQDQRWEIADAPHTTLVNFNSGLQIEPSGGQGSQIEQWDNRSPYLWSPQDFVGA